MKKFFGGMFIEKEILNKEGIYHPIKLEYYTIEERSDLKDERFRFGLEVVKTEYYPNDVKIERKEIRKLASDDITIKEILTILKENRVTPVGMQDVLKEILAKRLQIVGN